MKALDKLTHDRRRRAPRSSATRPCVVPVEDALPRRGRRPTQISEVAIHELLRCVPGARLHDRPSAPAGQYSFATWPARWSASAASARRAWIVLLLGPGPGRLSLPPGEGGRGIGARAFHQDEPLPPTTASGWSPASASCRPPATSSSAGSASTGARRARAATTTCASSRTGRGRWTVDVHGAAGTRRPMPGVCALRPWPVAHARSGDRIAIAAYLGSGATVRPGHRRVRRAPTPTRTSGTTKRSPRKSGRLHAEVGV